MSPRTDRPPKENPRKVNLNIRLTENEARDIQECAEKLNLSRTDIIMRGIQLVKAEINRDSPHDQAPTNLYNRSFLLQIKSLNTDKAWEVYDYLADFYFRIKEETKRNEQVISVTAIEEAPKDKSEREWFQNSQMILHHFLES